MPELTINGRTYEVDEDSFLMDPEQWTEDVAKDFATTENIDEMQDEHWKLVRYIRTYYESYGIAPMIRKVTRDTGFDLDKMYALFQSGPAKGACKVAGLPKPQGAFRRVRLFDFRKPIKRKCSMDFKDRISQAADAEFPGCAVIFDDQAGDMYRFQVESSNGRIISRTYPLFNEEQINAKSDEELRALIRQVCGR